MLDLRVRDEKRKMCFPAVSIQRRFYGDHVSLREKKALCVFNELTHVPWRCFGLTLPEY